MLKTQCDSKGRIYLTKSLRAKYGERFIIVKTRDGLLFLPVPADPIKDLEALGKPLQGFSLAALKQGVAEQAAEEAVA